MFLKGRLITFEGGEGAGKSSQLIAIKDKFQSVGIAALASHEPGGTRGGQVLRSLLLSDQAEVFSPRAQAMLFAAGRIDHLEKVIIPALEVGNWLLCDRFIDSTVAYQGVASNGDNQGKQTIDLDFLAKLEELTLGGIYPDLTFILDITPEIGLKRTTTRQQATTSNFVDRFEQKEISYHHRVRDNFLQIASAHPQRCIVINAEQSQGEVTAQIWRIILARFKQLL